MSLSVKVQREDAIFQAHQPLTELTGMLRSAGYAGPIVLAGGYLRDTATLRAPKDLDLFLDNDMNSIDLRRVAYRFGHEMSCASSIVSTYGSWAADVATLCKYRLLPHSAWPWTELPRPESVDLVFLDRETLTKEGYIPVRDRGDETETSLADLTFLDACLARVDLRLNAIGITERFCRMSPHWDDDAEHNRLVIQQGRHDHARITKRLDRLLADKFAGWTAHMELDYDGSIGPPLIHGAPG